jgi:hypothetical protein
MPGIHGSEPKQPDVMISTKDWGNKQSFLHCEWNTPGKDEVTARQSHPKGHIHVALQNGERMHLNVYTSQL